MAAKQPRQPAPDDTAEAVSAANAALASRARLESLRFSLAVDLKAAVAHRDVVGQEVKAAELEVVLSGDPPAPALAAAAVDARRALDLAGNAVTRLEHAIEALPVRLAEVDEQMLAASLRLGPLLQEARQAGTAEFEREVIAAAAPLVALAARWRARSLGLNVTSTFLAELRVPSLTTTVPILSGFAALSPDGTRNALDDLWRADPDAVATFQAGQSLSRVAAELDTHSNRIRAERQAREIEARNNRPAQRQRWNHAPAPSHPMPPGPRFTPNSWSSRQPGPVQIPADRVLTGNTPATPAAREIGQPFQPSAGIRWPDEAA